MQIVTDRGADLSTGQMERLSRVYFVPLKISLEGKNYLGGEDLSSDEFYTLLNKTEAFPTTSQPSAGQFADLYRKLAKDDPEILSIHISSGLSGTLDSARAAAELVPEAHVTFVDSKTLSCPLGWQVEVAARALEDGWPLNRILERLGEIQKHVEGIFTLSDLKYLIHGGRISHIKGLVASLLNIKPIIGVDKVNGKYISYAQEITLRRAISRMVNLIAKLYPEGTLLRVQPLHGSNLEGVQLLIDTLKERLDCKFETVTPVAPVLGAHTGPSLVGLSVGPMELFKEWN